MPRRRFIGRGTAFAIVMAIGLSGCYRSPAAPLDTKELPRGATILPGDDVPMVFNQCSRAIPSRGEATWEPTASDIVVLEAGLAAGLSGSPIEAFDAATWRSKWNRRYVGIVRSGKRFIYGDFSPVGSPTSVCDGGPSWFGIEYDVAGHKLTHIAMNGSP